MNITRMKKQLKKCHKIKTIRWSSLLRKKEQLSLRVQGRFLRTENALIPNLGCGSKAIEFIVILLRSVGCTHFIGIMYFTVKFQRHFK